MAKTKQRASRGGSGRRTPARQPPAAAPRFNWTLAAIGGGIAAIGVVVFFVISQAGGENSGDRDAAIAAEADASTTLPGEFVNLPEIYGGSYSTTGGHVTRQIDYASDCSPTDPDVCNSNPPAGGPHWSGACGDDPSEAPAFCGPAPFGVYEEEWEPETLVHNMEHAGVVLWYNTDDQQIINELQELFGDRGGNLVMAPYSDMEEDTIAVTSWSRIEKFAVAEYTKERVGAFIDSHLKRFNPEGF